MGESAAEEASLSVTHIPDFDAPAAIRPRGTLDRDIAIRSALKAGLLGIFIGLIPFLGIVLTGALAVYLYRREGGSVPAPRVGSRVGAAAGVVSFAISALFTVVRVFAFHAQQQYIEEITKIPAMLGYNPADPDVQATIHGLITPSGMALTLFFGMIFTVLLAALGGAVAAVMLRPSSRQ
jgi:hypothetical protein